MHKLVPGGHCHQPALPACVCHTGVRSGDGALGSGEALRASERIRLLGEREGDAEGAGRRRRRRRMAGGFLPPVKRQRCS